MIFNNESTDNDKVRYFNMHVNRRDDGTYDIMYSNTNAEFTLTPDIVVVQKSISVAGGIYNRVKDEEYKRPKDLTDEDLKTLFTFSQSLD